MKKIFIAVSCLVAFTLSSCTEDSVLENNFSESGRDLESASRSLSLTDSIVQLKEEDFPKVNKVRQYSFDDVYNMMHQLDGVPIQIQSTQFNMGNNTLEFVSPGKELKLASFSKGKSNQLFYIKILPASSGIPYLLYTWNPSGDSYPIGVGSYTSDPDRYVVYAKDSNTGSLFGFAWDFMYANSKDGFVIENQDIIGQGSGGWMDIYYYSISASNGNLTMERTNKGANQEFVIIPDYTFKVTDLEFYYDEAQIANSESVLMKESDITNDGADYMDKTFTISETRTEECSFVEQKGITLSKNSDTSFNIGIAGVFSFGTGGQKVQKGESQTITYSDKSTIQRVISDETNYKIPPYTRTVCQFMVFKHTLNVPYKITCKDTSNKNLTIEIRGVWNGVDYTKDKIVKKDYPLDGSTRSVNTEIIDLSRKY